MSPPPVGASIYALNNNGTDLGVTTAAGSSRSARRQHWHSRRATTGTGALTVTANGNVAGTSGGMAIYARTPDPQRDHRRRQDGQRRRHRHYCVQPRHGRDHHHRQRRCYRQQWSRHLRTQLRRRQHLHQRDHRASGTNGQWPLGRHYCAQPAARARSPSLPTATSTATNGRGIYAQNSSAGTALSVTTGAGTTGVSGTTHGISARNAGTGSITITANGNVTATSGRGIYAQNPPRLR